jgi:hypothetical protein
VSLLHFTPLAAVSDHVAWNGAKVPVINFLVQTAEIKARQKDAASHGLISKSNHAMPCSFEQINIIKFKNLSIILPRKAYSTK